MSDTIVAHNLLHVGRDDAAKQELFEVLAQGPVVRIERIVSRGQTTPEGSWYDQEDDEWVVLLAGEAVVRFASGNGEPDCDVRLVAGDGVLIPAHLRHRVVFTSTEPPCVWLAVHGELGRSAPR